ncbi:MAG: tRNA uridine-5-carboxymethylaminomethyl(34) synthesis enzyme MnmG [Mycoplasmataceae bacterium]|nr:tRNA uridine-5-carboxymethylaminomethyl(34) synthesis enzyme MnmG [Mycoplasmataceae bacterium]
MIFDVIVVGAGHAGLESAFVCSRLGYCVALITLSKASIALVPCNPSIGGPAKGIVTREIDALGGMQAKAADACCLQIKMLNTSKGPGVWALRSQIDKLAYQKWFLKQIKENPNISLIIDEVESLITKKQNVVGVNCTINKKIQASKVIVTTGTYLNAISHIGTISKKEGPQALKRSQRFSQNLKKMGFELIRLKTGTPPRVVTDSINFKKVKMEKGSLQKLCFNHFKKKYLPIKKQLPCYLTYTNKQTHKIIEKNLKLSAMYSGNIKGVGPRYCPSIEDKIVRFANKPRHQIFIEPESIKLDTMYLQGLSTSLPERVQEALIHSVVGLESAKIAKYGYAIEYDAINPIQLWPSLESKQYHNLYFAGQINGTSGYEEAACQGLMAGINASLSLQKKAPLILKRNEAYIGVLIDDLATKGITDPYRLLTSRAEHRLVLRNDNAIDRLIKYGYSIGLISQKNYEQYLQQQKLIKKIITQLKITTIKQSKLTALQKYKNGNHSLYQLLKRPEIKLKQLMKIDGLTKDSVEKIEILIKFDGYIKHQQKNIDKFNKYDDISLKKIKNYYRLKNLSLEAKDKLNSIKPLTLGQAKRISGINLVDLMIIKYYIDHHE